MRNRLVCTFAAVTAGMLGGVPIASAQTGVPAKETGKAPRTPDGQPDLQGVWTNSTLTPLERPAELAGKTYFTEQEAAEYEKRTSSQLTGDRRDGGPDTDVGRSYNEFWRDRGTRVIASRRTSLITDPPDGRIPPLIPSVQARLEKERVETAKHSTDGPEYRNLWERCLTRGLPIVPGPYNNDFQIVQSPGYVVILHEMIHDARIIPLDGRPHVSKEITGWMGDPRGHWEGDTLVVDTTNFSGKTNFHGSSAGLHLVERFTRVDADTISYEFTVDDPGTFSRPWSAQIPMNRTDEAVYEYACQEGNYALQDILAGARAEEKKAASR
jgi:hypothetical protein